MNKYLIPIKNLKKAKMNKKAIINEIIAQIKNIDLLSTSISGLYSFVAEIQNKLKNI